MQPWRSRRSRLLRELIAADRAGDGLLARATLHAQAAAAGGAAEILVGLHALQAQEELLHLAHAIVPELQVPPVLVPALCNIAAAGHFAADRSIEEYAQRIWKQKKIK